MRSNQMILTCVLAAALLLIGCAGDGGNDLEMNSAALTDDCVAGCVERGGEEGRCAESCASIGGDGCVTRCTEHGGDEGACEERCAASGTDGCFDRCVESGADVQTCRDACMDSDARPSSVTPTTCIEGEETIRDGVTYVCTDGDWVEK